MRMFQARRIACSALVIGLIAVQEAAATTTAAELGCRLRDALGFDARTLSCLGVDAETYALIDSDAESFCDSNRATVESLIDAVTAAKAAALVAYEKDGEVATADLAVISAIGALAAESGSAISNMTAHLTVQQQASQANVANNRLLDPNLALLELASEARDTIRAAQQARDLMLKGHCSRKDLAACAEAVSTFEAVVTATLSGGQQSERSGFQTTQWSHWADAQAHDESQMGG